MLTFCAYIFGDFEIIFSVIILLQLGSTSKVTSFMTRIERESVDYNAFSLWDIYEIM